MKNLAFIVLFVSLSLTISAQKPKTVKSPAKTQLTRTTSGNTVDEKEEFEEANKQTNAAERISALLKFVRDFPNSTEKIHAQELIVSGRAEFADEKMRSNDTQKGIEIFKLAIKDAPTPISDKLFSEIILQIPTNIFFRGQRTEAVEAAQLIEEKIRGNAKQMLGLATFYIGTENAAEAKRLADKAIELEPNLPAAYQTLGLANRLNFQLEDAVKAYSKALELGPESVVSRRSLAEMKRAVGKSDEAVELYRQILLKDDTDSNAETGLILSLFNAGKITEAETELTKSLAQDHNNLPLLVGAAYWYAAHGEGAKAVELGQKAVNTEPRYTWAHIALAQGLIEQKRPLEAERVLLTAQQYGNFPTLDYELATVRMSAGFYREAADGLKKTFSVSNDTIKTRLGGRVVKQEQSFIDLLAAERKASIFEPDSADNTETAERLKSLLDFSQQLDAANPNEAKISETADKFVGGDDKMKLHRQLYTATKLLEKKVSKDKALELTKGAVGNVDAALDVATPAAAVLADELYDSRTLAISRNEVVVVPDVPRQTLSNILRGRIEELSGWALYQQEKPEEAVTRFKRALSVLPEKSAWWRDSMWRLGSALQTGNKLKEALDAYIKSYTSGAPETGKRIIIESLYQSVNGNLEGLDEKIGPKPESNITAAAIQNQPSSTISQVTEQTAFRSPLKPVSTPTPEISATPATDETTLPVRNTNQAATDKNAEPVQEAKEISKPAEPVAAPAATPEVVKEDVGQTTATPNPTPETEPNPKNDVSSTEVKTEPAKPETVTDEKAEPKAEEKPISPPAKEIAETKPEKSGNSGFDRIIITVPKNEPYLKPTKQPAKIEEKPAENNPVSNTETEIKPDETVREAADFIVEKNVSGQVRPRIVGVVKTDNSLSCKILTSQENVSILSNGGSLGILVGFENTGSIKELTAQSSSPADIEITFEPEIGALSGRAFYVIKSVSANTGTFSAVFESPCGKKEVLVKVR